MSEVGRMPYYLVNPCLYDPAFHNRHLTVNCFLSVATAISLIVIQMR